MIQANEVESNDDHEQVYPNSKVHVPETGGFVPFWQELNQCMVSDTKVTGKTHGFLVSCFMKTIIYTYEF